MFCVVQQWMWRATTRFFKKLKNFNSIFNRSCWAQSVGKRHERVNIIHFVQLLIVQLIWSCTIDIDMIALVGFFLIDWFELIYLWIDLIIDWFDFWLIWLLDWLIWLLYWLDFDYVITDGISNWFDYLSLWLLIDLITNWFDCWFELNWLRIDLIWLLVDLIWIDYLLIWFDYQLITYWFACLLPIALATKGKCGAARPITRCACGVPSPATVCAGWTAGEQPFLAGKTLGKKIRKKIRKNDTKNSTKKPLKTHWNEPINNTKKTIEKPF